MKQAISIQLLTCCLGLAGVHLQDFPFKAIIFSTLIILSLFVALSIAWSESKEKERNKRMLDNLILSTTPSDLTRKRITSAIGKFSDKVDAPITKVTGFTGGITKITFHNENYDPKGSMVFDDEEIAQLSILSDGELKDAAGALFRDKEIGTDESRSKVIDALSISARAALWENDVRTPEWCVWADDEKIAVPVLPPNQSCPPENRITIYKKDYSTYGKKSKYSMHSWVEQTVVERLQAINAQNI